MVDSRIIKLKPNNLWDKKSNPIGMRLGIIRGWESNWYGGNNFGEKLAEDVNIRKYLKKQDSQKQVLQELLLKEL